MNLSKRVLRYLAHIAYTHKTFGRLSRELRFKIFQLLIRLRSNLNLKANKIIWVNPNHIEYISLELHPDLNMGRVIDGDWDKSIKRFDDLDIYKSSRRRFIDGTDWNITNFYKHTVREIQKGKVLWGCGNKTDFDDRLRNVDELYYNIKKYGYKSNKDIRMAYHSFNDPFQREDEVTVNIGREGNILFNDGRHRLTIAKLLKIPNIPVKVLARHSDWIKFRKELIEFSKKTQGKLYQPLTHPDLKDIPSHYSYLRFDLIKKNLSIKKGTVLDMGAYLGYFCTRFDEMGFDCYAIEYEPICIYFMKKLKKINKRKFKVIKQSIFDYNRSGELSFDIVLALNIFHHFLKTKEAYEEFISLLKRIKVNEMFFQSHDYDEDQMKGAYKNLHPEEFADLIANYTNLKYKLIGTGEKGRKIFKFFHSECSDS